jgi:DNA-binding CsgD family transcriptional regulator
MSVEYQLALRLTASPDFAALEGLGLTRREAEVLGWVASGKTNPEIATMLGARSKTVSKHLERVYQKLGVENRTTAAARSIEAATAFRA